MPKRIDISQIPIRHNFYELSATRQEEIKDIWTTAIANGMVEELAKLPEELQAHVYQGAIDTMLTYKKKVL